MSTAKPHDPEGFQAPSLWLDEPEPDWDDDDAYLVLPTLHPFDQLKAALEVGANPNEFPKFSALTPLVAAASRGDLAAVELLLAHGARPNSGDPEGALPLMVASGRGDIAMAQVLIAAGARINFGNEGGICPLHIAVDRGDVAMVRFLLSQGADPGQEDHCGGAPLETAIEMGHTDVARLLQAALAQAGV